MTRENKKMSFNATWSMAVGGMVGGGFFSVLGVIIGIAGQWAWLSFVLAGLIALISVNYLLKNLNERQSGEGFSFYYCADNTYCFKTTKLSFVNRLPQNIG
ncbi:MAG: hypothetical protein PF541_08970 [Prolixibacteraceae bacterium]|jgi:amino acid transporter|nr:hypothetical protein [Prolixibacteraceae bacterium]